MKANITFEHIIDAQRRIRPHIKQTPIYSSKLLNEWLGHEIYFKMECFQKTGAFKIRGASNVLSKLKKNHQLPKQIIANSSGNHAQGVAYAASLFNIPTTIYCGKSISSIKAKATQFYEAKLNIFESRKDADDLIQVHAQDDETLWIPPFDHDDIIAGQGTAALEAFQELGECDAIAAPCGGGGLLSGSLIAARTMSPKTQVIGVEPLQANDAAISLRTGSIHTLPQSPLTLADGAATLAIGEKTFNFLKQVDEFYEAKEESIAYWTQWLQHLLKAHIEPTSAMAMDGVVKWLTHQSNKKSVLVIISGGNIDQNKMHQIWERDYLQYQPSLRF